MEKLFSLILFGVLIATNVAIAQSQFKNTLFLDSSAVSPHASLSNIEWIEGHWRGEAFGGITEAVWTPPLGGSMMCVFKLVVNGQVSFYEIVTITEQSNTLMLRLKHFHQDLKGWEEKNETIDFPLVKVTNERAYFDGFTFERVGENEMNIFVMLENNGVKKEQKFSYLRIGAENMNK